MIEVADILLNLAHEGKLKQVNNSIRRLAIQDVEDKLITITLSTTNGHRQKTAKILGMSLRSLQRKIAERRKECC